MNFKTYIHVGIMSAVAGLLFFSPPGIFIWGVTMSLVGGLSSLSAGAIVAVSFFGLWVVCTALVYASLYFYRNEVSPRYKTN